MNRDRLQLSRRGGSLKRSLGMATLEETFPKASPLRLPLIVLALTCWLMPAAAEEQKKAQGVLPEPSYLGAEWYWPWDIPRNFTYAAYQEQQMGEKVPGLTREDWIAKFWKSEDPRPGMTMMILQLEMLSDEDFKEGMAGLLGLMGMVNEEGGELGATLMPGEETLDPIQKATQDGTLTREMFLNHLRERRDSILDVGYADYNRGRANGKPSDIPGYVEHDEDSLGLKIIVYDPEYMTKERLLTDLSQATMNKTVAEFEKMKEGVKKGREQDAEQIAKEYERYAEQLENQKVWLAGYRTEQNANQEIIDQSENRIAEMEKGIKEIEDRIARLLSYQSQVRGAPLQNVDGGWLVWYKDTDTERRDTTVIGKARLKNAVLEFSLTSEGVFADGAPEEMQRVINLMVGRLGEIGVELPAETAVSMDMMRSTGNDFQVQPENIPAALAARLQADTGAEEQGATDERRGTMDEGRPPAGTSERPTPILPDLSVLPPEPDIPGVNVPRSSPDKTKAAELVKQGNQFWHASKIDQAEYAYRQALQIDPNNAEAYNGVGGILASKNDWSGAEAAFRQAYRLEPDNYRYTGHVAISLGKQNKNLPEAEQLIRRAISLKPEESDLHYQLGVILMYQRQWTQAEAAYRQAITLNSKKGQYHHDLAAVLLEQSRIAEAKQAAQEAIALGYKKQHSVYAKLGLGDQIPAQPPVVTSPEPDMRRFGELLWSNQLGTALTESRRLSEQHPNHPMVGVARIGLEIHFGNVDIARQTADALLRLHPDNPYVLISRGQAAYWSNDKKDQAIMKQMFDHALKIDPNIPSAYYNQGVQFYDRQVYAIAYQQFATVAAMSPNQMWMSRYYLGITAEWLGNVNDAITQYEAFLKQNPPADWANAARANLQRLRQNQR